MTRAYYNEIDAYAAQWLRNLIAEGLIADGDVDTRSISDVTPNDVRGYTQCHFFAGIGGWSAALRRSGVWPDHRPVWTGSCPCQPFSLAGKQAGFADERHLWPHFRYLIAQCRPASVLGEQVASAAQWLRLVRGDLEAMGYAVGAIPVEAASAGADHLRDRYWFVAHSETFRERSEESRRCSSDNGVAQGDAHGARLAVGSIAEVERGDIRREGTPATAPGDRGDALANPDGERQPGRTQQHGRSEQSGQQAPCGDDAVRCDLRALPDTTGERARAAGQSREYECLDWVIGADGKSRRVKSGICLLAHGVPNRVAKLRAFGNAIDLRPAAAFIQAVHESLT